MSILSFKEIEDAIPNGFIGISDDHRVFDCLLIARIKKSFSAHKRRLNKMDCASTQYQSEFEINSYLIKKFNIYLMKRNTLLTEISLKRPNF